MIALDTNVLVRLIVEDDLEQWRLADELLTRCVDDDVNCLVTVPVLCETVWVLRRVYRASRDEIALTMESLLDDEVFEIEQSEIVSEALRSYRAGPADFADYLIGTKGSHLGATTTYTFDRGLRDAEEFTILV